MQYKSLSIIFCLIFFTASYTNAQYFGRNKVQYDAFDFKVVQSPHFEIYHYLDNDSMVNRLVQAAERWYLIHQEVLKDTFDRRNPVIIYNSHADFQQTNAVSGRIGVGTGGVTEGLKNRVIMPLTPHNANTYHVLGHELVHAFQYHILKSGDSTSLRSVRNLPLWMVEGLAEYMSIGRKDAHTAMWMRDAVLHDDIPTIEDLTKSNEYFPYRYGQAFWAFVSGVWGDDIIRPLFINSATYGYEQAIDSVFGFDAETLSNLWSQKLRAYYKPYLGEKDSIITGRKLISEENSGEMNISPSISPDGNYVAFLSEKSIFTIDLFLADAHTGEILKKLSSTVQNSHIDAFSFIESAGAWSPNSNQFAFVVFSEGKNVLSIIDVGKGNSEAHEIPGVPAFSNPAWSPDGNFIVVTGLVDGQSDLYLYDLKTEEVIQLTDDVFSDLQPSWSDDGNTIIFTTDRPGNAFAPSRPLVEGLNLARLNLNTKQVAVYDIFPGAVNVNPLFSPDNQDIYFLSNAEGFRDLYRYSLVNDKVYRLTDYFTGISGITPLSPALSIAKDKALLAYSLFDQGKYTIYEAKLSDFRGVEVDKYETNFRAATLPPAIVRPVSIVAPNLNNRLAFPKVPADSIEVVEYNPKFRLDYISNTAGVGVSTGRFGTGLAGGVNMLFGDILGNHQLFAGVALNGQIYDFGGQVAYVNQKNRINWGVSLSHIPYRYASYAYSLDTVGYADTTLQVTNLSIYNLRNFQDQVGFFSSYGFSQTRRLEFGGALTWYSYRLDRLSNYYYRGLFIDRDKEKLDAPESFNVQQANIAYVGDNSFFGLASPMLGHRYRFQVEKYFGEFDFLAVLADYRRYFFFQPFSFGIRLIHHARYGDINNDRLPPLSIAYPTLIRGYDTQDEAELEAIREGTFSPTQLFGNRTIVGNLELRLPFTGPERLALIKSGIFFTEWAIFLDGGLAWDRPDNLFNGDLPQAESNTFFDSETKPIFSTGLSLRVNLFGYIVIEPYYAIPIRENGWEGGNFGLNFAPGW